MGKNPKKQEAAGIVEEEAFVRGGGSGVTPIVKRQLEQEAYAEAEADFLSDSKGRGKGKRRKGESAVADGGDEEDAFFSTLALQGQLPKFAELLKFRGLSRGCKLWGAVIEIKPRELIVSLPHGLRGHVAYAEASDWLSEQSKKAPAAGAGPQVAEGGEAGGGAAAGKKRKAPAGSGTDDASHPAAPQPPHLSQLFSIGQLVRCTITGLQSGAESADGADKKPAGQQAADKQGGKGKKRVDVSLRVSKMNAGLGAESLREGMALPACVRSVEDHGYTLTLGIKGVSGFLPKAEAESLGRPLAPGSLLDVVVPPGGAPKPAGGGGSVLTVGCAPAAVAAAVAREWDGLNIGSLLPGQLVTARVRNVLSDGLLCSFLTYFSGTVDPFHLGVDLSADWRKQFSPNQRIRARILYVDPAGKRVALSLQRHLLANTLPPNFPMLGQVFDSAIIRRIDEGLGVLLELPAQPGSPALTAGYAHISNVAEQNVEQLGKRFRVNQKVKARVLGFRPMDGLAAVSLKPSVVESNILTIADVRPGMPVTGTVQRIEEWGLLVALSGSIRALVPVAHASDLGSAKALRKYKVGQEVAGKVLTVDSVAKKVTVTLKPALVGSKLPPITCLQDALPGGRSHGVVTGAQDFGVFLSFFGGVSGLAHASECGLAAGQSPKEAFTTGQVVKCRILAVDPQRKGLKLSLVTKKKAEAADADKQHAAGDSGPAEQAAAGAGAANGAAAPAAAGVQADQDGSKTAAGREKGKRAANGKSEAIAYDKAALAAFQPGDVVHGTVTAVHSREVGGETVPSCLEVAVQPDSSTPGNAAGGTVTGRLEVAHLADQPAAAAALVAALQPGSRLGPLLVLQRLENVGQVRLTRKASLLAARSQGMLPASVDEVKEGMVLAGYVASITHDGVFVRFLGGLTGRAGLAQLADTFVSDPHLFFREGQSVTATVVQVDTARQRFSVALKQSLCTSPGAQFLRNMFADLEAASAASAAAETAAGGRPVDWSAFAIGSVVPGEAANRVDYGLLCDLAASADVVGMAANHQIPMDRSPKPGAAISGVVLDVNKAVGAVDISLLPRLLELAQIAAAAAGSSGGKDGMEGQQPSKKKQKKGKDAGKDAKKQQLQEGQEVEGTVELVRDQEGYCVLSFPPAIAAASGSFLGCLATTDFNLQSQQHAQSKIEPGTVITARVAALPSEETGGRLLLAAPLDGKQLGTPNSRPAGVRTDAAAAAGKDGAARQRDGAQQQAATQQQKASQPAVGSTLQANVTAVHALHAELAFRGGGGHGRLHITEAAQPPGGADHSPLTAFKQGSELRVAITGRVKANGGRRYTLWECSTRPEALAAANAAKAGQEATKADRLSWTSLKPGQLLKGYVQEVEKGYVWCVFTPTIKGRAFAAQASSSLEECEQLGQRFWAGKPVQAAVINVDRRKHALDVAILPAGADAADAAAQTAAEAALQPQPGVHVLGRIVSVGGGGVRVQLSAQSAGHVAITDVHDSPVENALAGLAVGQYCLAAVLGPDTAAHGRDASAADEEGEARGKRGRKAGSSGTAMLPLSLRRSAGGQCAAHSAAQQQQQQQQQKQGDLPQVAAGPLQADQLTPGQKVAGYVKSSGPAGVFVCLARGLDARIRLSQLADGFVDSPAQAFPEGRLVTAQVLNVDGDKVDLTLRGRRIGPSLESLQEGQVVRGRVKSVAKYGMFVELEGQPGGAVTGLAHVSEVADDFVKDLSTLFTPGQRVLARVLKVERKEGRLSLGLKPSYFEDLSDAELSGDDEAESDQDFDAQLAMASASSDEEGAEGEDGQEDSDLAGSGDDVSSGGQGGEEGGSQGEDGEGDLGVAGSGSDAEFDLDEDLQDAEESSSEDEED